MGSLFITIGVVLILVGSCNLVYTFIDKHHGWSLGGGAMVFMGGLLVMVIGAVKRAPRKAVK